MSDKKTIDGNNYIVPEPMVSHWFTDENFDAVSIHATIGEVVFLIIKDGSGCTYIQKPNIPGDLLALVPKTKPLSLKSTLGHEGARTVLNMLRNGIMVRGDWRHDFDIEEYIRKEFGEACQSHDNHTALMWLQNNYPELMGSLSDNHQAEAKVIIDNNK